MKECLLRCVSKGNSDGLINIETLLEQAKVKGQTWDVVHQRAELSKEQLKNLVEEDKKYVAEIDALFQEKLKMLRQKSNA